MARSPRIPNWLPLEQSTIYFLTICVQKRQRVLANPRIWKAIIKQIENIEGQGKWTIFAALAMPDHLHLLASPSEREYSISGFVRWFKACFNDEVKPSWQWQAGAFDRLLRKKESVYQKWEYVRLNPVRAGLVQTPEEWLFQIGFERRRFVETPYNTSFALLGEI
jgi:putative transposase